MKIWYTVKQIYSHKHTHVCVCVCFHTSGFIFPYIYTSFIYYLSVVAPENADTDIR